jgi:hypothetical protein
MGLSSQPRAASGYGSDGEFELSAADDDSSVVCLQGDEPVEVAEYSDGSLFSADPNSHRIEPSVNDEIDPQFMISGEKPSGISTAPSPVVRGGSKRRKKGGSWKQMVAVGMGGLSAIPIAAGILLAIDRFGFRQAPNIGIWPLDGSLSTMSAAAPRASAPVSSHGNRTESTNQNDRGRSLASDLEPVAPSEPDAAASALAEIASGVLETAPTSTETIGIQSTNDVTNEAMKPADHLAPELITPEPDATSSAPSTELVSAASDALKLIQELGAVSGDQARKPFLVNTFIALSRVGSLVGSNDRSAVSELIEEIKSDSLLITNISDVAVPQWLSLATPPNDGIVAVINESVARNAPTLINKQGKEVPVIAPDGEPLSKGRFIGLGKMIGPVDNRKVELSILEPL